MVNPKPLTHAAIFPRAVGCVTEARRRRRVTSRPVCASAGWRGHTGDRVELVAVVMATRRALHFVFKVGDRFQTARFFRDVLGMKVQTGAERGWRARVGDRGR